MIALVEEAISAARDALLSADDQASEMAAGRREEIKELHRAVIHGSVMGSFCCEKFGVDRFRTLTRAEIDARFEEFKAFTEF